MSYESSRRSGGFGFCGLLAVLFIGLKLGGIIQWSWWWVLGPLWIPPAVLLSLAAGFFLVGCLMMGIGHALQKK